ncbi:MFS transporter [Adhaeribacter aquaticus]|uniref:MFS transporter n=1 Tax=Adhaeribacter aquaticus TaxID=299567 RepID=UPI00042999AA|nr:MFS transporter [Adhaeribacter aquaticus]
MNETLKNATPAEPLTPAPQNSLKLVILASAAGTLIEWYDLFLAVTLANTLSMQLFPAGDSKFLETLAIVASSYLIRPIGSLLFGNIGDKVGRKYSFLVSLLLMGAATFLIGCIPTYNQIGWLAPFLLLICRLFQGLAISGEYAGATIYVAEHSPANKRGFYTGFIQTTSSIALILCLAVVFTTRSSMSEASFNDFGWRIPFLFSSVLVIMSYVIRRKLHESPVFSQLKKEGKTSNTPVKDTFKSKKNVGLILAAIFGGNAAQSSIMQTNQFVALFFLQRTVKLPDTTALLIIAAGILLAGPFFQIFGNLSDKIGRKKVILSGLFLGLVIIPLSFYTFLELGNPQRLDTVQEISTQTTLLFILMVFLITMASALVYGPMAAFLLELFPTRIRYTSMGFTYNIGNGAIGGSTPFITELIKASFVVGAAFAPYVGLVYPIALVVLGIVVNILFVPETYKNQLTD